MLNLNRLNSLGEALRDSLIQFKTNTALIEDNRDRTNGTWTYREFQTQAERVGALLQEHRFGADDRCAILMSNQSKWLFSATGAFWVGAILVPIDYKLTPKEQASLLVHAEPKALIVEWPAWQRLVEEFDETVRKKVTVLVTEAPEDANLEGALRWEAEPKKGFRYVDRKRSDVACIVYSSGTGGTPKGCMLTHANYLAQAEELGKLYPITEQDRYFSILPTNHAIDFMCGYFLPLQFGAAIVHQRTLRPEFLGPTMKRHGVSHMAIVPMILKALEKRIREKISALPSWKRNVLEGLLAVNAWATERGPKYELSRRLLKPIHAEFGGKLRLIFAGGAFVDASSADFFYRLGIPVVIGYGLTEAGTVLTVNDLRPFRSDTVGKPISGLDLDLRNPNSEGVGEVWVRGPTVMKGYFKAENLTKEAIQDGWLRTGDLGTLDASGHLKLVGRAKNMIVTDGGKNIYPEDIESAFEDLPGAQEHCVFAANYIWPTYSLSGEKLVLVVRPKPDRKEPGMDEAVSARNQSLPDFKRVSGVVLWEADFPRTASMKLKREQLAVQLRDTLKRENAVREV